MQEFLAQAGLVSRERVDARKSPIRARAAIRLARDGRRLISMRGQRVSVLNMTTKDGPSDEDLTALIVGPAGNLRAPALRSGTTLLVGFHLATLAEFFGV